MPACKYFKILFLLDEHQKISVEHNISVTFGIPFVIINYSHIFKLFYTLLSEMNPKLMFNNNNLSFGIMSPTIKTEVEICFPSAA